MKKIKIAVGLYCVLAGNNVSAADACIKQAELEADKVRFVEVHLKVAALQCRRGANQQISRRYSQFVREKMPYLIDSQEPLMAWLKRRGNSSLDQYIASMEKSISLGSAQSAQFCGRSLIAAEYSEKSHTPVMLLPLLPISYEKPAVECTSATNAAMR